MTTPRYLVDVNSRESREIGGNVYEDSIERRQPRWSSTHPSGEEKESSPIDQSGNRRMQRSIASATPSTVDLSVSDQSLDQRSVKSGHITISGDRLTLDEASHTLTPTQQSASTFHSFTYHMEGQRELSPHQVTPRPTTDKVLTSPLQTSPPPPSIQSTQSPMVQSSSGNSSALGSQFMQQQEEQQSYPHGNSPLTPAEESHYTTKATITFGRDQFESAQSAYDVGVQVYLRPHDPNETLDRIFSPQELALSKRAAASPSTPTVATTPSSETVATMFDESPVTPASFAEEFQQAYLVSEDDDEGSSSDWSETGSEEEETESQLMRKTLPSNFFNSKNLLGTPDPSPEEADLFGDDPMSNDQFYELSIRPDEYMRDLVGAPEVSKPPIFSPPSVRAKQKKKKSSGRKKKKSKNKKAKNGKEKKSDKNAKKEMPDHYHYRTIDANDTTRRTRAEEERSGHHNQLPHGESDFSLLKASTSSPLSPSVEKMGLGSEHLIVSSPAQAKFTSISLLESERSPQSLSSPSDQALLRGRREPRRTRRPQPPPRTTHEGEPSGPPSHIVVSPRRPRARSEEDVFSSQHQRPEKVAKLDTPRRSNYSHHEEALSGLQDEPALFATTATKTSSRSSDEPPASKRKRSPPLEGGFVSPRHLESSRRSDRSSQEGSYRSPQQFDASYRTHVSSHEQSHMSPHTPLESSRRSHRSSQEESSTRSQNIESSYRSHGSRQPDAFSGAHRQLDSSARSDWSGEKGAPQSPPQSETNPSQVNFFVSQDRWLDSSRTSPGPSQSMQFDSSHGSHEPVHEDRYQVARIPLDTSQGGHSYASEEALSSRQQMESSHRSRSSARSSTRTPSPHAAFAIPRHHLDSYGRIRRSRSQEQLAGSSHLDSSAGSRRSRSQEPYAGPRDHLPREGSLYPSTALISTPMPPEVNAQLDSSRRSRRSPPPFDPLSMSPPMKPTLERKDESYRFASPYDQDDLPRKAELKGILKSTTATTLSTSTSSDDMARLPASHRHDNWGVERVSFVPYPVASAAAAAAKQPEVVYDEHQMFQRSPLRARTNHDLEFSNRSAKTTSTAHSSLMATDAFDGYGDTPVPNRVRFALQPTRSNDPSSRKEGYVPDAFGQFSPPDSTESELPPGNDYNGTTWFTRRDDSLNSFLSNESDARPVELRGKEKWRIWCRQVQWFWVALVFLLLVVVVGVSVGLALGLKAGNDSSDSSDDSDGFSSAACSLPRNLMCVENSIPTDSIPTCVSDRYDAIRTSMNVTQFAQDSCDASNVAAWAVATLTDGSETVEDIVELFALSALYFSTEPTRWVRSDGWVLTREACLQWRGVTCQQGRVVKLELDSNNLRGSLPSEIGYLSNVEFISMRSNDIRGSLPSEIISLSKLSYLNLRTNDMEGELPFRLGDMETLETLLISSNRFSGTLPSSLGNLSRLGTLHAGQNKFIGAIPSEFGKLESIETLILSSNRLKDSIPTELGLLTRLKDLRLDDGNWFAGSRIPTEFGRLVRLEKLSLDNLALSGGIPSEFGSLTAMTDLSMRGNRLGGTLPVELSQVTRLIRLRLQLSEIGGTLPPEWGELTALTELDVSSNKLTGTIPPEYGELSALERFFARDNELFGEIPSEVCSLRPDLLLVGDFCSGELTCITNPDCCECLD